MIVLLISYRLLFSYMKFTHFELIYPLLLAIRSWLIYGRSAVDTGWV